jgi:hypothetical protein
MPASPHDPYVVNNTRISLLPSSNVLAAAISRAAMLRDTPRLAASPRECYMLRVAARSIRKDGVERPMTECSECGARYSSSSDSCAARFDQLLALDHSRREPWGSRHGQAFAAFALQHPIRHRASVDSAWTSLYRIYCLGHRPTRVFGELRAAGGRVATVPDVPARPSAIVNRPAVTIADLGEFSATGYPTCLDEWCRAALRSWGAPVDIAAP